MAKVKIDMSGVKTFLFEKGEKVGLIVCAVLTVVVFAWYLQYGLTSGGSASGRPWEQDISEGAQKLVRSIQSADLPDSELPPEIDTRIYRWLYMPSNFFFVPMFPLPDKVGSKKLNPKILSPLSAESEKYIDFDYVRGLYHCWHIDAAGKKAWVLEEKAGGAGGFGVGGNVPGQSGNKGANMGGAASGGATNVSKDAKPVRMLVVSGVFPMRDQLDEFRRALRYATLDELLAHRDELPKPLGIEVMRVEIMPDGRPATTLLADGKTPAIDWKPLLKFNDKSGKLEVAPSLRRMMQEMLIDETEPQKVANYVFPGLVMPLPKLANTKYAKLDLKGFSVKEMVAADEGAGKPAGAGNISSLGPTGGGSGLNMPGKGGNKPGESQPGGAAATAAGTLKPVAWKTLSKELQDKFFEKFFPDTILDPLGHPPATATTTPSDKKPGSAAPGSLGPVGGQAPGGAMGGGTTTAATWGWELLLGGATGGDKGVGSAPQQPGAEGEANKAEAARALELENALIRFFDPDVQPGKTYRYCFRVRMANPNFNKKADVAFQALADQKELDWKDVATLGWVFTPSYTIPTDFHWYAVDVTPDPKIKGGADPFPPPPAARPETTPIQIHSWLDAIGDGNNTYKVGDWVIAERLYLRRGDVLGRQDIMLEFPKWTEEIQAFEIAQSPGRGKVKPSKEALITSGVSVNIGSNPPSILVDFEGGKRMNYSYEKRDGGRENIQLIDASAVDVLVLTPDGKLVARNSRVDSESETPTGAQRAHQFQAWRERLQEVRGGAAGGGAGPAMPGAGRAQ